MAKSTPHDSLETVSRLLDIVPYLSSHQGIALEELAKAFSVSVDQMTKDLTTLWMCGLPGYTAYELIDLSFDSGFVTISNAETLEKPRALNRDEVLALLLGLESLREDVKDAAPETLSMVTKAISRLTDLIGTVVSRSVQSGDSADSAIIALIQKAIAKRTAIEIDYHSFSRDELTHRIVHPFEISSDAKFVYLFAYCETSASNRTFRVDRIAKAVENSDPHEPKSAINSSAGEPTLNANIRISSRQRDVAERLNSGQTQIENDQIALRCFSSEWAVREIMSFGGSAQVVAPQALRVDVAERASRALAAYLI